MLYFTIKKYPMANKVTQIKPIAAIAAKPTRTPPNIDVYIPDVVERDLFFDFAI
jgi:hypothetical protein